MAARFPFTDARLEALQPAEKRYFAQDDKTPGLFLRVATTGHKAFYLKVWFEGKYRWDRLGVFQQNASSTPIMSLRQARDQYAARRAALGMNGEVAQRASTKRLTLNEAWRAILDTNPNNNVKATMYSRRKYFDLHLKRPLGRMFLHEIRPRDIENLRSSLQKELAGRTVNEAFIILQSVYTWAIKQEYLPDNYVSPLTNVKRAKIARPRTRRLHAEEFAAFWRALDKFAYLKHPHLVPGYHPTVVDAIKMMLFTGARSTNVRTMRWSEISLDRRVWTIPATKTKSGREYTIPLTSQAVEIIQKRYQTDAGKGDYVFPGKGDAPHLGELRNSWRSILDLAGLDGLTMHDLRRTQGSVQADLGINLALIGEALCHSDISSTAVYTHAGTVEQLRGNMERANAAMTAAAAPVDAGLALTVDEWETIASALGDTPLAAKVRALADVQRVA